MREAKEKPVSFILSGDPQQMLHIYFVNEDTQWPPSENILNNP